MKRICFFLIFVASFFLLTNDSFAQCAMCRATAESNLNTGNTQAIGLNTGILYLMCIPYIAFGIIGYFWYKNSRRTNAHK